MSNSSAFSKTSLTIRKFTVRILLKPGLENFAPTWAPISSREGEGAHLLARPWPIHVIFGVL